MVFALALLLISLLPLGRANAQSAAANPADTAAGVPANTPQTEAPAPNPQAAAGNTTGQQPCPAQGAAPADSQTHQGNGAGSANGSSASNCPPKSQTVRKGQQTKRMLWIVPNFAAVSANTQVPALTVKGKFWLATQDSFDYSSFVWTGIITAQDFGLRDYPEFGQGAAGFARYYWHNFVDGVSGTYFTEAIIPVISREDPRYYTLEHGNILRRLGYALSRTVVTKTDSGGLAFNWSEVGGNALEAALSNAYYPQQERGGRQTAINWGDQMESAALNNIAKEFWPDIRRIVFRRK